jgi:hypothetical protein
MTRLDLIKQIIELGSVAKANKLELEGQIHDILAISNMPNEALTNEADFVTCLNEAQDESIRAITDALNNDTELTDSDLEAILEHLTSPTMQKWQKIKLRVWPVFKKPANDFITSISEATGDFVYSRLHGHTIGVFFAASAGGLSDEQIVRQTDMLTEKNIIFGELNISKEIKEKTREKAYELLKDLRRASNKVMQELESMLPKDMLPSLQSIKDKARELVKKEFEKDEKKPRNRKNVTTSSKQTPKEPISTETSQTNDAYHSWPVNAE